MPVMPQQQATYGGVNPVHGSFRNQHSESHNNMPSSAPSMSELSFRQQKELSDRDMIKQPAPLFGVDERMQDQSTEIDNRQDYFPQSSDYDVRRDSNNFQPNHNSFHRDHSGSAQRNQSNLSHSGFMKDPGSNVAPTHDYRQTSSSSFLFGDNFNGPSLPDEESFNGGPSKHTSQATYTPRSMRHTGSPLQSVPSYDPSYSANRTVCTEDGGVSVWSTTTFNDSYQHAKIVYSDFGSPLEVMEYVSYPHRPIPSNPNGVVIKVEASTVSRTDSFIRANKWHEVLQLPNTPGCDCIGRVFRVGESAGKYGIKVGDRVATYDTNLGSNARYIYAPAYELFKIPSDLDAAEGVCLIQTYATAYQCLNRTSNKKLKKGDKVLIIGGNGAVGQACVQLAVLGGASEVYATANEKHHEMLSELGATPLGREPREWGPVVRGNMNIVIDCVCADSFSSSWNALSWEDSKLVCVGLTAIYTRPSFFGTVVSAQWASFKANYCMSRTTFYDLARSMEESPGDYRKDLKRLIKWTLQGKIKPKIAQCITLEDVPDAHENIEKGGLDGMIVCLPWLGARRGTN